MYGLVSTKNVEIIRYIGISKYDSPSVRLNKHYEHAIHSNMNRPVYDWMRKHINNGYRIEAVVLEVAPLEDIANLEENFIATYRLNGFNLLNATNGGEGVSGYRHSEESRQKMKDAWARRKTKVTEKRKTSLETKMKISASMSGRKQTADHTRKIVESRRLNKERRRSL